MRAFSNFPGAVRVCAYFRHPTAVFRFNNPTRFVRPAYDKTEAIANEKRWVIMQDGDKWLRIAPSPTPKGIYGMRPIKWLLERGSIAICAGGGIPTLCGAGELNKLVGVEAVIDRETARNNAWHGSSIDC